MMLLMGTSRDNDSRKARTGESSDPESDAAGDAGCTRIARPRSLAGEQAQFTLCEGGDTLVTPSGPKLVRKLIIDFIEGSVHAMAESTTDLATKRSEDADQMAQTLRRVANALAMPALEDAASAVQGAVRSGDARNLLLLIAAMDTEAVRALAAATSSQSRVTWESVLEPPAGMHSSEPFRPRVLVIDDEPWHRELLADVLSDEFEVFTATCGLEGLESALRTMPEVVLLDVTMPDMDGYEVCRRLKAEHPTEDLAIIFVTGTGDVSAECRALELGASDYVNKPINPVAVRARVRSHIALRRARAQINRQITQEKTWSFAASLIEKSPAAVIVLAPDYSISAVNPAAEKLLWYRREELVGSSNPLFLYDRSEIEAIASQMPKAGGDPASLNEVGLFGTQDREGSARQERTFVRNGGSTVIVDATVTHLTDDLGETVGYMITAYDISERKRREEYISHLAHHDRLTGLPTRQLLADRISMMIERSKRSSTPSALLMIDLDEFKLINDSLGHHVGDKVLIEVAERLRQTVRAADTVARVGGDEFVVLTDLATGEDASRVAEKILMALRAPVTVSERQQIDLKASIGVCVYPNGADNADLLMRNADTAMYYGKKSEKNCFRLFSDEIASLAVQHREMEEGLRVALRANELELYYQPQFSIADGTLVGVEALLRWNSPRFGSVSPARFIPVAERSGLIVPIGAWVIRTACKQLSRLQHDLGVHISMAVNVSPRQIQHSGLLQTIGESLRENYLDPSSLEVEITETLLMSDIPAALSFFRGLRDLGVRMAIDDFGTGYSSMSYLLRFAVNRLKIDRCFIDASCSNPSSATITNAIISLAHQLQISVVAEGVETSEQLAFLRSAGCDFAQGFLLGRPVPYESLITAAAV